MHDEQDEKPQSKTIISQSSLVPISVMVGVVLTALWLNNQFSDIRADLKEMRTQLTYQTASRWTSQDMKIYTLLMKQNNPALAIPDPDEIRAKRN